MEQHNISSERKIDYRSKLRNHDVLDVYPIRML